MNKLLICLLVSINICYGQELIKNNRLESKTIGGLQALATAVTKQEQKTTLKKVSSGNSPTANKIRLSKRSTHGITVIDSSNPVVRPIVAATYTITGSSKVTSAGVYKTDGVLVRTLWSGETRSPGTYVVKWDGTDDRFNPLPLDNYIIKVLSNNVKYQWEGVAGNTSNSPQKQQRHGANDPPSRIIISGGRAYYSVGYNEGNGAVSAFDLNQVQTRIDQLQGIGGTLETQHIATDGTTIYMASVDNYHLTNSFIWAQNLSDKSFVTFNRGTSYKNQFHDYGHVMGLRTTTQHPTGIAVNSSYVFVSYYKSNIVAVYQKLTGALLREISILLPTSLFVDGNNIWIAYKGNDSANKVAKYLIKPDGSFGAAGTTISGFSKVANIAVGGSVLGVVDGGTSQQVKAYNSSTGTALWTLGREGGVLNSPVVTNDRFGFWTIDGGSNKLISGGMAFQSDGSFWLTDPSNNRIQHYDQNRHFIERIAYMQNVRTISIVGNNNTRILGNGLEYRIDYSRPYYDSWTLKYNWTGQLANFVTDEWIKGVNTLSNGRTYGLINRNAGVGVQVVELDTVNGLRYTKVFANNTGASAKMYADGSIYGIFYSNPETFGKMSLINFDANGDPIYSNSLMPATTPLVDGEPFTGGPRTYPYEKTSSNIQVLFNGAQNDAIDNTYHLGGIDATTGKMMFRTSLSTFASYEGPFPDDGYFDIGNGVRYAGNAAVAFEKNIIWGYNGEFWKQRECNMYNHYNDDGLLIGQFGVSDNSRGIAGNAYNPEITKVGKTYYLYHNDESVENGIHRWKITGLNTIAEQIIHITPSFVRSDEHSPLPLGMVDLMSSLPYRADLITSAATGWTISTKGSEEWSVHTNIVRYNKRKNADVSIIYNGTNAKSLSRSLGTNSGFERWSLYGNIQYHGTNPNSWDGNGHNAFLDVLDKAGKIIVRIYQISDVKHVNTFFTVNHTTVFSKPTYDMQIPITSVLRPLAIRKLGDSITVSYYGYSTSVTTPYETGADFKSPTTMRMYFNSGKGGDAKKISLDGWKFSHH